jgi:hypothetical protein
MAQVQHERARTSGRAEFQVEGGLVGIDIVGGGVQLGFFDPPAPLRPLISWPGPAANEPFDPELAVGLTTHLATVLADARTTEALPWRDNQSRQEAQGIDHALGAELESITERCSSAEPAGARESAGWPKPRPQRSTGPAAT